MLKKIVCLVYSSLLIMSAAKAQQLTLSDAVELTIKNNPAIKQYEERLAQKEYQDHEAFGNFLPSVNINGSYNHLNDPLEIDLSPIRSGIIQMQAKNQVEFANVYNLLTNGTQLNDLQRAGLFNQYSASLNSLFPSFSQTLKKQDYKSASVTIIQPLFMGGKLWSYKQLTSAERMASEIELNQIKNEKVTETLQSYLTVLLLNDVIKTRMEVLEGVKKHRDRAKKLLEQGLIASYNLLRAEVAVSEAENNLSNDRNKFDLAILALKNSIGSEPESDLVINDMLAYSPFSEELDSLIYRAKQNNPLLQVIALKKEAASQKYNIERSAFLPTVAAFGKYELYPEYLSALEPRWVVGVQASFNLFNGLKDYSKLQAASHLEEEILYLEDDAKEKISLLVTKNFKDVKNACDRFMQTEKTVSLAQENLRLNSKRFETGLGTSLEVIDAVLSFERVVIDNKSAVYEYYKSLASLYNSVGDPQKMLILWNSRSISNVTK